MSNYTQPLFQLSAQSLQEVIVNVIVPVGRADVDSVTLELVVALRVAVPVSDGGGELAAAVGVGVEVDVLEEVPLVLHVVEATCVVLMVLDPVTTQHTSIRASQMRGTTADST